MSEDKPLVLVALGVPDHMGGPGERGKPVSLPGNSGLVAALTDELQRRRWPVRTVLLLPDAPVPRPQRTAVLLSGVCEPSIHRRSLGVLARWEVQTRLPVINPSSVAANSGRASVARRLSHQVGVQVPSCTVFAPSQATLVEHIEKRGHRYPIILRPLGEHGSQGLKKIDDADSARKATAAASHVTDWVDFRSGDGHYRKYRCVFVGDRLYRRHILIDKQWNLTGDARWHMFENPSLIAEEKEWMAGAVDLSPGSVESRLLHQFRALQLDFGSTDFGILPNGDLVIFEINACVQLTGSIPRETSYDWTYLEGNNPEILEGLLALLERRALLQSRRAD